MYNILGKQKATGKEVKGRMSENIPEFSAEIQKSSQGLDRYFNTSSVATDTNQDYYT